MADYPYPFFYEQQDCFPRFDYRKPAPGVVVDYRSADNKVGHQQRCFTAWWALHECSHLDLGLDIGSPRGLTPLCIAIDKFCDGKNPHPVYGGMASADVVGEGSDLSMFPSRTFPYICSNHSLEHMPGTDMDIVEMLLRWLDLLRPGGVLALVIPDSDWFDVLGSDPDHKPRGGPPRWGRPDSSWGHSDFPERVLDAVLGRSGAQLLEYDTFQNHFSFNVVVRKVD